MVPLTAINLSTNECDMLRNWASAYGAAVWQRTVRQETIMAKHRRLPEFVYQRQLPVGEKVNVNFQDGDLSNDAVEEVNDSDEGQEEFDESSEEIDIDIEENTPEGQQDELG